MEVALQQEAMGLQLKQIEAQNRLANAEATKSIAEANKIAGVDTEGAKLDNEWKTIENRIQLSRENIEALYRDWETDRKSTRLNSSHRSLSRMPSSA